MFVLQLIDGTNSKKQVEFNRSTAFLAWQYLYYMKDIPEYKKANLKNVSIIVDDFTNENYSIGGSKGYYRIYFKYDLGEYYHLNDNQKKKEINNLYYKYLKILFDKLELPIEPLTNIYHLIEKNNYELQIPYTKTAKSKDRKIEASVILKPEINSFIYCLIIKDVVSKERLQEVILYNTLQGSSYFYYDVLHKIIFIDNDTIQIINKKKEIVCKYSISTNKLDIFNENNHLSEFIIGSK
ncbi:MAG: hypothetical protein R2760_07210 [Chitinophagales bacterium]